MIIFKTAVKHYFFLVAFVVYRWISCEMEFSIFLKGVQISLVGLCDDVATYYGYFLK